MKSVASFWSTAVVAVSLLAGSGVALAWDGVVEGIPTEIDVTDGADLGFRVYVAAPTGGSGWCSPSYNWAYLNSTDSNYSAYVATVLTAKATGSSVLIYQTKDANGYCHIGYLAAL
jgi:hypothetical protein